MTDAKIRAAVYARISLDATGLGLGVSRQLDDCRKIARDRDWEIVQEYIDNNISATNKKKVRPQYNEMYAAYHRGEFEAVICWDLDRLTRQPRQLEDWIDAAEQRGLRLTTANGEADLTTDGGRMYARIKSAVARAEMERKSARQRLSHDQRAAQGRPWTGGSRAFGFQSDGIHHDEAEAEAVAQMYNAMLRGAGLTTIAHTLNESGLLSSREKPWTPSTVSQLLRNPKNAGLLAHRDRIVGMGNWEPIVGEDLWRAVNGILSGNPNGRQRTSTHLLSLLADCGLCSTPLTVGYRHNKTRVYRCPACTKISRNADRLDLYISAIVIHRLNRPDANQLLMDTGAPDMVELQDQMQVLRLRLEQYAKQAADGDIGPNEWKIVRERINANLEDTEAKITLNTSAAILTPMVTAENAEEAWERQPLDHRRAVIRTLLDITVNPTRQGSRFNPDDIDVQWRKVG